MSSPEQPPNQEYEAERRANYSYFNRSVYDRVREIFGCEPPELPADVDLLALAEAEGGLPFEAFIDELEGKLRGP